MLSNAGDGRNAGLGPTDVAPVVALAVLADVAANALDVGASGRGHGDLVADSHRA